MLRPKDWRAPAWSSNGGILIESKSKIAEELRGVCVLGKRRSREGNLKIRIALCFPSATELRGRISQASSGAPVPFWIIGRQENGGKRKKAFDLHAGETPLGKDRGSG